MFENEGVEIPCPKCGQKIAQRLGDLTRQDDHQLDCPGCGAAIRLDTKELRKGIEATEQTLDDLKRRFQDLFR